eukprot:8648425-Alexandrium_andersonii.AAC.1
MRSPDPVVKVSYVAPNHPWEVAVLARSAGLNGPLRGSEPVQAQEPRLSEAGAGGATFRAAPSASGSALWGLQLSN